MLRFLKKVFFNNPPLFKGFSLIELVIGILITMVIGAAIMEGTSYYRNKMLSIDVEEAASNELKNFTNYWKSKIAAGEWQDAGNSTFWREGLPKDLFTTKILNSDNPNQNDEEIMGRFYYKAEKVIKFNNYDYYYYTLETKVTWNILTDRDSLTFVVDQIVFN